MLITVLISYCDLLARRKILNQKNQEIREPTQFPSPIQMKPRQKQLHPTYDHTHVSHRYIQIWELKESADSRISLVPSNHTLVLLVGESIEERRMESDSEMVAFPLLPTPIESNYRASTIPYRFPSDNPRKATPTEISWIDLFLNSIPSFKFLLFPLSLYFFLYFPK